MIIVTNNKGLCCYDITIYIYNVVIRDNVG